MTRRNIGFLSTRFAGTDGVSLETAKWAAVLERLGHCCFYFAGQCDRPAERSMIVPEAFYRHPEILALHEIAFNPNGHLQPDSEKRYHRPHCLAYVRPPRLSRRVDELKHYFKEAIYDFLHRFEIDLLIVENALAIPLNLPLGLAVAEVITETGIPTIAHHHDFVWERQRFTLNCVQDYIAAAFPPRAMSIRHVVINTLQASELAWRVGVTARVIPNVMDFDNPPQPPDDYASDVRQSFGMMEGEYLLLQPTRVIQRKGIEHAIELARRLELPAKLVISHASGDEGDTYEHRVREYAALLNVNVRFEAEIVQEHRSRLADGRKVYTLGDVYPHADLVTYPSTIEGFGNAFLEAVYYRRPLLVNNYSIYEVDIKPKGFRVIEFNGFISEATLKLARDVLLNPAKYECWADENYALARRYFSFAVLQQRLEALLADCFGYQV